MTIRKNDMWETKIFKYDGKIVNENWNDTYKMLKSLYDEILHKDQNWHFINEYNFIALRWSERYDKLVRNYFTKNNICCDGSIIWVDEQELARKNQKEFAIIFHGISELAMNVEKAGALLFDRIYHPAFLMLCYKYSNKQPEGRDEALLLAERAISRASYNARLSVYNSCNLK